MTLRQLISLFALLPLLSSKCSAVEVNQMCPVYPGREASADYATMYDGAEVRFCCSECIIAFQRDPESYVAALPQLQDVSLARQAELFAERYGMMTAAGVLLALLIVLRIRRLRMPIPAAEQQDAVTGIKRLLRRQVTPTIPLLILSGYLGWEVYSLQHRLHETWLKDEIHFATFHDFGFPPVPRRPDVEPRVEGTYYRGNDERNPKLFNNGDYRTATFHVSLVDADYQSVNAGDSLSDRQLYIRLEIDRPPFTPDFLYDPDMMNLMFLTAQCEPFLGRWQPVSDAVQLTEIEPMQKWEALFPVDVATCCPDSHAEGTVYVCEKHFYPSSLSFLGQQRGGSRFHYGIRYQLDVTDGRLAASSDVYMGALYRTRKFPTWRVPMSEWFSHEPIPVLPGENSKDPELLGLPEHQHKHALIRGTTRQ